VNGSWLPVFGFSTDVEVTGSTDVVEPCTTSVVPETFFREVVVVGSVVVVVPNTSVDPETSVEVVDGTVVVVAAAVVVVSCGCVVVVSQLHVVGGTGCVVVVAQPQVVVGAGCVVVVSQLHVVGGTGCVVVVVAYGAVVVVEVELVVDDVVVLDAVVVVPWLLGPQNCTFETSGVFLPFPTFGRPAFENEPLVCGGTTVNNTESGPPFTITAATGSVECQFAPLADWFDSVTTCSFPDGSSNE
jgi:hypothetical protein